jgi:hypothetical protein
MTRFRATVSATAIVTLLLGGCAGLDASAPIIPTFGAQDPNSIHEPLQIKDVVETTIQLQNEYGVRYQQAARAQDFVGVPLIAAAAGATGALLFGATTDTIAAIGLGAGTLAAYNSYFSPGTLAETYLAGHRATSCLLAHAAILDDRDFDRGTSRELRATLVTNLTILRSKERPSERSAAALYDETVAAATAALTVADNEIAAYDGRAMALELERSELQTGVASKVSKRTVSFTDAQTQIRGIVDALLAQQKALAEAEQGAGETPPSAPSGSAGRGLQARTAQPTTDTIATVRQNIRVLLDSLRPFVETTQTMKLCWPVA